MSDQEASATLKEGKPVFLKSSKWFSPDKEWVRQRVQDGKFNNSKFVPDRYTKILEFKLNRASFDKYFTKLNKYEYMLNVRQSQMIKYESNKKV